MKVLFLSIFLLFFVSFTMAQPAESDSVGYIFIGGEVNIARPEPGKITPVKEKVKLEYPVENNENAIFRKVKILRIYEDEQINKALLNASYSSDLFSEAALPYPVVKKGLIKGILEGLAAEKFIALSPQDMQYACTFPELLRDIGNFEQQNQPPSEEIESGLSEFGIKSIEDTIIHPVNPGTENLTHALDLVVEEGVWKGTSRNYFRILYLQLLWYNPESGLPPKVMAVIPYTFLKNYLTEMHTWNRYDDRNSINVHEFIQAGNFHAYLLNVD
ncbi:MAG: hypothetical protein K1X92_11240 [Bacteroidia bacterium]|nr:hypothetical protein [Bacteroidia bacterium]